MRFYGVIGVLLGVLALLSGLFYWLSQHDIRRVDFSLTAVSYNASAGDFSVTAQGKPLVLHFVDHSCSCARYSEPHIKRLQTRLASEALHIRVEKNQAQHLPIDVHSLVAILPATPAVAIFDAAGSLRYFGPYSNGDVCGEGKDMVVYTLAELEKNSDISWLSQEYVGCVCPWQKEV